MQIDEVLKNARVALKKQPRDTKLHELVAPLYEQLGRYAEAIPHLAFLVAAVDTPDEQLYLRYVKALVRTGAFGKALQVLERALAQHPESVLLAREKEMGLALLGRFEEARDVHYGLCELYPDESYPRMMVGMYRLLLSDMKEGYDDYAVRDTNQDLQQLFGQLPEWDGTPIPGKKLIISAEQGIGDVIMFAGLLSWAIAQQASITLAVTDKLVPLLSRSFPDITFISESTYAQINIADFDYQLPIGHLMKYVLKGSVPQPRGAYLQPDAERVKELRSYYQDYAAEKQRTRLIGLSWHTTNATNGFVRNISLSDMAAVLSVPGIQFVSLQYGDHHQEIAECNKQHGDVLFSDAGVDAFDDIDGLAAQIAAMDEVITIDNSTAHLAGALGLQTTLLLSSIADWRWGLKGDQSHWYQSVTFLRQEKALNWKPVIKQLRAHLMAGAS